MAHSRPLAIDLFTGLHGWAEGLVAEGFDVIGFDLEDMCGQFGVARPEHVSLAIQDVLTLHGSQFRNADLIVASPPCQEYSYMAMPWTLAKAKAAAIRADTTGQKLEDLNRLFNACFRIQREACEAAGRRIPLIVENVKGAQPWVGRARWSYGSFFLWGDVPALMPIQRYHQRLKVSAGEQWNVNRANFTGTIGWDAFAPEEGRKTRGMNWSDRSKRGQDFTRIAGAQAIKVPSVQGRRTDIGKGARFTSRDCGVEGVKIGGDWFSDSQSTCRKHSSKSKARKFASTMIAKIPLPPEPAHRRDLQAKSEGSMTTPTNSAFLETEGVGG